MKNFKPMPLVLALAAVLVLASLGWLVPLSRDSSAAPAPSNDPSFKGKVLLVKMNNMTTTWEGFLLENAQVQKIGNHSFLIGKSASDGPMVSWSNGRTLRLQMEHIISITEFDDLKDAKKALNSPGNGPQQFIVPKQQSVPVPVPVERPKEKK